MSYDADCLHIARLKRNNKLIQFQVAYSNSLVLDKEFFIGAWSVGQGASPPTESGISKIFVRDRTKRFLPTADFHGHEF